MSQEIASDMHEKNTENLTALLKILNETQDDQLLMKSEVFRNLGLFEESRELLSRITDTELASFKEILLKETYHKNKRVVRLK